MRRPLISGASLSELLASAGGDPDEELSDGETPDEPETVRIDPDCAEKLEHARGRILNLIKEKRPRFVPAFELMTFRDNTISVSVPTTELREEILRSKTGMLMRIAELAGIEGMIELEVTVNEEIRAARPIKLDIRIGTARQLHDIPKRANCAEACFSCPTMPRNRPYFLNSCNS